MRLDRLDFGGLIETNEDRYRKADPLEASVCEIDTGEWSVKRTPDADAHVVHLARHGADHYGDCSCDGYRYHDGPCSHLSLIHRLERQDRLEVPHARVRSIDADIVGRQQAIAGHAAEPDLEQAIATDGGREPPSNAREHPLARRLR